MFSKFKKIQTNKLFFGIFLDFQIVTTKINLNYFKLF